MKTLLIAAGAGALVLAGPAMAETRTYDLSGFDEIDASAAVDVEVEVGGDYSVRAETNDGDFESLDLRVRGDALVVGRQRSGVFNWGSSRGHFRVYVTMPRLVAVEASSASSVSGTGVDADDFDVDVSSGADVDLAGACDRVTIDVSSGGEFEGRAFECRAASIDASSGAEAEVHISEEISVDASSGADVTVWGGPKKTTLETSSGANVRFREGGLALD